MAAAVTARRARARSRRARREALTGTITDLNLHKIKEGVDVVSAAACAAARMDHDGGLRKIVN